MATRDALREFSRRLPAPPEFEKILESLHEQTDLAIAIIGAAILEAVLENLIAKKLPILSPELEGRLFKKRGPLSDFESKILLAIALDIIPQEIADKINSIRIIRNVFAHAKLPVSFETESISKEILNVLKPYVLYVYEIIDGNLMFEDPTNKRVFVMSIRILGFLLDEQYETLTGKRMLFALTSRGK